MSSFKQLFIHMRFCSSSMFTSSEENDIMLSLQIFHTYSEICIDETLYETSLKDNYMHAGTTPQSGKDSMSNTPLVSYDMEDLGVLIAF